MARAMVRRAVVRSPRRGMFWEGAGNVLTPTTGASLVFTCVGETTLENVPNPTLIRIRGEVLVYLTAVGASGAQALASMGMIIQSKAAIAAGVASMPSPFTDIGSDWLWHYQVPLALRGSIGADNEALGAHVARIYIDNKSMRKVEQNQALVFIVENVVLTSTVTFQLSAGLRFLFKK